MKKKLRIMTIFGTRPEAIKLAPILLGIKKEKESFESIVVITGQHREMLEQVLKVFNIRSDFNLKVMEKNQSLTEITCKVLEGLKSVIDKTKPDIILVHGDTTTTLAASIAGFYNKVPIGHVEAGLRTWKKYSPFPEEMNRQLTDVLSDLYFAPTELSKANLEKEGHEEKHIFVTGNTAIDALNWTVDKEYKHDVLNQISKNNKIILLTMHRRENLGQPMINVFEAIKEVVLSNGDVEVIYPVHMSPRVRQIAFEILGNVKRVHLIEPLDVIDFHNIAAKSYFIMTDAGGVQEEAPSLNKPVLVLRDNTERPEGVQAGTLKLVGTDKKNVKDEMINLLTNKQDYEDMASSRNPYGDGYATERILNNIKKYFGYPYLGNSKHQLPK